MDIGNSLDATLSLSRIKPGNPVDANLSADQVGETLNSFGTMLKNEMDKINTLQSNANTAVHTYATGGSIELHNVITAVEKADMALQLAVQVRNRLVGAYQEISRMQV